MLFKKQISILGILVLCFAAPVFPGSDSGQDQTIAFDSDQWKLGPGSRIVDHLGKKALTGSADLTGIEFENGVIEVDIAFSEARLFPGIVFRKQNDAEYEEFYVRPHKPGQPDALQYTPVFNNQSGWQLYYGEGYTGAWTFPKKEWVHFKFEIKGTQARVYIGDGKRPAMVIRDLKHGISKGGLGIKTTGPSGLAFFSDFKFRSDNSLEFETPPEVRTPMGIITDWQLSPSFLANQLDAKAYPPSEILNGIEWNPVKSEAGGIVNIARWLGKGPIVPAVALAKTTIRADESGPIDLEFGYSDLVSIFLNGQKLYSGRSIFRQRDPFFQGYVGLFDSITLELQKGNNELMLILTESMGGWGFMCRNTNAVYQHEGLKKEWEISHSLSYPETVLHDQARNVLYISNLYSNSVQYISKVGLDGEILEKEWVKGLAMPTGMAIQGDTLYVVERSGLAEIDILSGEIKQRHQVKGPGFLNDIAIDSQGRIYISDGQRNRILRFEQGQFTDWKKGTEYAGVNGLHYYENKLYVGASADFSLKVFDLQNEDPEAVTLVYLEEGAIVDGIENDEKGNILVSDYNGQVYRITKDGEKTLLLDRTAPKGFCANFCFIPGRNLLIIPSLQDNRISAYKLNDF